MFFRGENEWGPLPGSADWARAVLEVDEQGYV